MFLYHIFVLPLVYLFEILIHALSPVLAFNPFIAIFIVSFIVNFLSYPIFKKIEEMCVKDNETWQKLMPKINSIKRNFKGAERRMLLQTYFRQNNYHPLLSHFKQSLTIFLQVPIFIASYIVICENPLFQSPFFDAVNTFFVFGINIRTLPILMTVINAVSVLVYMKNRPFSAKLYAYGLAFVFLVLLYFSPASIVVYWIFNNTFAFLRNIWFYRKNIFIPSLLAYLATVVGIAFYINFSYNTLYALMAFVLCFVAYKIAIYILKDAFLTSCVLLFCSIYLVMHYFGFILFKDSLFPFVYSLFIFEAAGLCYQEIARKSKFMPSVTDCILPLLCAFVIFSIYLPLKIINSDPAEFYAVVDLKEVLSFEAQVGFGLFFMYPLMIFTLQKQRRKLIYYIIISLFIIGFVEICMFQRPADVLNVYMQFSKQHDFLSLETIKMDSCCIILVFLFISFSMKDKKVKFLKSLFFSILLTHLYLTATTEKMFIANLRLMKKIDNETNLNLSTSKKNVLVLFLDRAVSGFFPLIMKEKPELKEEFTGFIYYPYTVSFAPHTLYSTPSLFGGYDYTPLKLQNDAKRQMVDKHNEAITIMPEEFRQQGYKVTLIDMPYINYNDPTKPNPYHSDIQLVNTQQFYVSRIKEVASVIKRNIIFFILFRLAPSVYKENIYNNGLYMLMKNFSELETVVTHQQLSELETAAAHQQFSNFEKFIDTLKFSDEVSETFALFVSLLPHCPVLLTENYQFYNNSIESNLNKKLGENYLDESALNYKKHYNVNMLSYIEVVKLLKKLKENNAYDNTRIIIVSDHGTELKNVPYVNDIMTLNNSLFLIKDFYASGNLRAETKFMTAADLPYLATNRIVSKQENLFNMKITEQEKQKGVDVISKYLVRWGPAFYEDKNRTYLYDEDVEYMHVDENNIKEMIKFEGGEIKK